MGWEKDINGVVYFWQWLLNTRVFGVVESPTTVYMRDDWEKLSDEKSTLRACYVTEWRTFTEWRNDAHHIWTRQWKVDFYPFDVRVSMLAWVGRFPQIRSFHARPVPIRSSGQASSSPDWHIHLKFYYLCFYSLHLFHRNPNDVATSQNFYSSYRSARSTKLPKWNILSQMVWPRMASKV